MAESISRSTPPPPGFDWINCPLCGSTLRETLLTGPDRMHAVAGTFQMVRCAECELVYQNPRPTPERLAPHYPNDYGPYRAARRTLLARLGWRHGYELFRRLRFVTRFKHRGRLLDVGCASGTFLAGIREMGQWDALWGLELSRHAAAAARRRGVDVVVARFEDQSLPESDFDVITLWDVMEHLPEPVTTLAMVRRSLKPDGLLFLSVPLLDSLDARLFGRYWIGLDLPRHLHVPSRRTLRRLLADTGFVVLAQGYLTGSHHSFTQSLRLLIKARVAHPGAAGLLSDLTASSAFRVALMPYFLATERLGRGADLTLAACPLPYQPASSQGEG